MVFALLLTMGLDMSLPEFEPTADISGDYIVGSYDVSSDDFTVEVFEDVPVEVAPSVDEVIISSPVRSEQSSLRSSSNTVSLEVSLLTNRTINTNVDPFIFQSGNYSYKYVTLTAGVEYTFTSDAPRMFYSTSLDVGSEVYVIPSSTWTPDANYYAFVLNTRSFVVTYVEVVDDPSGNDPSGTDYSALINAVNAVNGSVNVCEYILLFMAFVPFLTKTVDKLMNKKED